MRAPTATPTAADPTASPTASPTVCTAAYAHSNTHSSAHGHSGHHTHIDTHAVVTYDLSDRCGTDLYARRGCGTDGHVFTSTDCQPTVATTSSHSGYHHNTYTYVASPAAKP